MTTLKDVKFVSNVNIGRFILAIVKYKILKHFFFVGQKCKVIICHGNCQIIVRIAVIYLFVLCWEFKVVPSKNLNEQKRHILEIPVKIIWNYSKYQKQDTSLLLSQHSVEHLSFCTLFIFEKKTSPRLIRHAKTNIWYR